MTATLFPMVDDAGEWLGWVEPAAGRHRVIGPPPVGQWRWSAVSGRWEAVVSLAQLQQRACDDIDAAVGRRRQHYLTDIPFQDQVYLAKAAEAEAVLAAVAASQPLPAAPYLAAEALRVGAPVAAVAAEVAQQAALWAQKSPQLEAARMGHKQAALAAANPAAVAAALTAALAEIDGL